MIRPSRIPNLFTIGDVALTPRGQLLITLSNFLMLLGVILLLYVGGLYAHAEYGRYAARGDTDLPAPRPVAPVLPAQTADDSLRSEPAPFMPILREAPIHTPAGSDTQPAETIQTDPGLVQELAPGLDTAIAPSSITRILIPAIDVDSKVVQVGWEIVEQHGQRVAVWQVAEYAVGHHFGSANPGGGNNIVLAGHVGGYGKVFRHLANVKVGDQITLESAGSPFVYIVREVVIVDEEGVSKEQQARNAQYIQPTDHEVVTLITCWPPSGRDKFTQRIIVRATPAQEPSTTRK